MAEIKRKTQVFDQTMVLVKIMVEGAVNVKVKLFLMQSVQSPQDRSLGSI